MEKKVGSHDRLLERLGEWDKTKTPADTAIEVFIRETCAAHPDEPRDIPIIRALIRFQDFDLDYSDSQESEFLYRLTSLLESRLTRLEMEPPR
jgi:hypothetical protein